MLNCFLVLNVFFFLTSQNLRHEKQYGNHRHQRDISSLSLVVHMHKKKWMNRNEWTTRFCLLHLPSGCFFLKLFRSKVLDDVTKNKWSELHFRYGRIWVFASQLSSIQLLSFVHCKGQFRFHLNLKTFECNCWRNLKRRHLAT